MYKKLEWLTKAKLVKKDPKSKRYNLISDQYSQNSLIDHPLANIKDTVLRICRVFLNCRAVLR